MVGSSLISSGMVCASLPDGLTSPNTTSASASPPASPSSQDSRIAWASSHHGATETTEPLDKMTATCGLTAEILCSRLVCLAGMSRLVRSNPSDSAASGSPMNMSTMSAFRAVSMACASSAGSAGSRSRVNPGAKSTDAPRADTASRNEDILSGVICDDPPP